MITSTSCISTLEPRLIYFPFVGKTWGKKSPNTQGNPKTPPNNTTPPPNPQQKKPGNNHWYSLGMIQ